MKINSSMKEKPYIIWISIMITLIFAINIWYIYESKDDKITSAVICSDPKNIKSVPPGSIKD